MESTTVKRTLIQTKLSEDVLKEVDHVAVDWGLFRNETFEMLLWQALDQLKEQGQLWSK